MKAYVDGLGMGRGLNESPSEKEGKCACCTPSRKDSSPLNESPSEKEGKCFESHAVTAALVYPQ